MGWWLAERRGVQEASTVKRFDPRFWTVNFPRPAMASVVTTAPDALRVDALFYDREALIGLIWEAEDRHDHVLAGYETARDFRTCRLRFRWRSAGVRPLDAVHGPTLTIEGRDEAGRPRAWYVRLWNHAVGTPEDAVVSVDFARLDGGFLLPEEADPVWAGDVDRMFVSIVPPDYREAGEPGEPGAGEGAQEGWVEMGDIACDGAGSVLALGDVLVPPHGLSIATGYDDLYHVTPARLVRGAVALGYRGAINHYVGMSHYFRLDANGLVTAVDGALNTPCRRWHEALAAACRAAGLGLILSLSYELFDRHCPDGWKQRDADGNPALTGWVPPSTLLSPANGEAMAWLQAVARAFVGLARDAGLAVRFQVGEPWWWVTPGGRLCLHDPAALAIWGAEAPRVDDVRAPMGAAECALLDRAGAVLAASKAALAAAAKDEAAKGGAGAETLLLVYLPTVLDAGAPELARANVPLGWAAPAFDVLQLEDYDWVTEGRVGETARGVAAATARLGYPPGEQHYLAGFVLRPEDQAQWAAIDAAAEAAVRRGAAECFVWALPQVIRDGYIHWKEGEAAMQPFDDVQFPIAIGREASVRPSFSTAIVETAGGHEQRNAEWADGRLAFDAGPGLRSEAELAELITFFRARMGAARAFRFRDPFDHGSGAPGAVPGATDQRIGTGDGRQTRFRLVKHYGPEVPARIITRPVAGSVRVAVDGAERATGWRVEPGGWIAFHSAPADGAVVSAGYLFDVAVRFAEDRLEVQRATFAAGEAPSVPLIEVKEA